MNNGRLFQILYLLLERREVTATWLAKELEVSQRTIYRDVDALSAAGIPVYARQGRSGGICLMDQFTLDRALFNREEQRQLLSALQSLQATGADQGGTVLRRLSALFGTKPVEWLSVDMGSWGSGRKEQEYFECCKQAIWGRKLLRFDYDNSEGCHSTRTVEPYRLCFKGGNWYLSAYCLEKESLRLFRLSRMDGLCMTGEPFLPREGPELAEGPGKAEGIDIQKPPAEPSAITFRLRFLPEAAYQVRDSFLPGETAQLEDGRFLVQTSYPPGRWNVGFLLSFGKMVEVLEPLWMRELLQKEAEEIAKQYKT